MSAHGHDTVPAEQQKSAIIFGPDYIARLDPEFIAGMKAYHETNLTPFDDDGYLSTRLGSQNRLLRQRPDLAVTIGDGLEADDDQSIYDTVTTVAGARLAAKPAAERPVNALLSYATLINGVVNIKDARCGRDTPNDRDNAICNLLGRVLVADISDSEVAAHAYAVTYVQQRIERLAEVGRTRGFDPLYAAAKLETVRISLLNRYRAIKYAEAFPPSDEQAVMPETIADDDARVANYFTAIQASRQSGLKLGYKPHSAGGSLIYTLPFLHEFADQLPSRRNTHPTTLHSDAEFEVVHSAKTSFKGMKPEAVKITDEAVAQSYGHLDTVTSIFVNGRGALYCDPFCMYPLVNTFAGQGKYAEYRAMQARMLADYYDMTHSVEEVAAVHGQVARLAAGSTAVRSGEQPAGDRPMDIIQRLLIPRTSGAAETAGPETGTPAVTGSEDAADNAPDDTPAASIRLHGVTWHRRPLPEGWSPSPRALALAAEAGIVLQTGETFVKGYARGSEQVGRVIGHQYIAVDLPSP